jgi:hypothetical protein
MHGSVRVLASNGLLVASAEAVGWSARETTSDDAASTRR